MTVIEAINSLLSLPVKEMTKKAMVRSSRKSNLVQDMHYYRILNFPCNEGERGGLEYAVGIASLDDPGNDLEVFYLDELIAQDWEITEIPEVIQIEVKET